MRRVFLFVLCAVALSGCEQLPVRDLPMPTTRSGAPTQGEAVAALKDALSQGVGEAIRTLGRTDGFDADTLVRIGMPEDYRKAEQLLRKLGQGRYVDEFELSLNRAAEQAVGTAGDIFARAVRQMTVQDGIGIVRGSEDAATQYFRRHTDADLRAAFRPIVEQATNRAGVTAAYKRFMDRAGPLAGLVSAEAQDIDGYVTAMALDGLFTYIAIEEKKIRDNPVARTTEVLRRVFGYYLG